MFVSLRDLPTYLCVQKSSISAANNSPTQPSKNQLQLQRMSKPLTDPAWQYKILNSPRDCLNYLEELRDIVNDNPDFIDHKQIDEEGNPLGARFYDKNAANQYLEVLVKLEKFLRPDKRLSKQGKIILKV